GSRPCHHEFLPIMEELEAVAVESNDVRAWRDVHNFRMWIAAMVGDRPETDRRLDAFARLADQVRVPAMSALRLFNEAGIAEYSGRLADAERLTIEGMQQAARADYSDEVVRAFAGGLFYYIR